VTRRHIQTNGIISFTDAKTSKQAHPNLREMNNQKRDKHLKN